MGIACVQEAQLLRWNPDFVNTFQWAIGMPDRGNPLLKSKNSIPDICESF